MTRTTHGILGALVLSALLLAACRPGGKGKETGYIPGPEGRPIEVTYRIEGGLAVYQGDIAFELEWLREYQEAAPALLEEPHLIGGAINPEGRWPEGVIPYEIQSRSDWPADRQGEYDDWVDNIDEAVGNWNDQTPVVMRNKQSGDLRWVRFQLDGKCRSRVGMIPLGFPNGPIAQKIRLDTDCGPGTIMHEIGHAAGFYHEQSRKNRHHYVHITEGNIDGDVDNFDQKGGLPWGPYDFRSIMHYGRTNFGRVDADGNQLVVINALYPLPWNGDGIMGQRWEFSKGDLAAIEAMYQDPTGSLGSDHRAWLEGRLDVQSHAPIRVFADFTGDGAPDAVAFSGSSGDGWLAQGNDGYFVPTGDSPVIEGFCRSWQECHAGDFNGDGRSDLVRFDPYAETATVALWNGAGFDAPQVWSSTMGEGDFFAVGDVDGDCDDDVVAFRAGSLSYPTLGAWVALAESGSFGAESFWGYMGSQREGRGADIADVNGDGLADFVGYHDDGTVIVQPSVGNDFWGVYHVGRDLCDVNSTCHLTDMNGDGLADLVAFSDTFNQGRHPLDRVRIALGDGVSFSAARVYHEFDCRTADRCHVVDLDDDGMPEVLEVGDVDSGDMWVARSDLWFDTDELGSVPATAAPACAPLLLPDWTGLSLHTSSRDSFTLATGESLQQALDWNYQSVRLEAMVYENAPGTYQPGTVPLKLFYSTANQDFLTTATTQGELDADAYGYEFQRVEGHVYPDPQPDLPLVPLNLYLGERNGTLDYLTTATTAGNADAVARGYQFVRIEGYVYPVDVIF